MHPLSAAFVAIASASSLLLLACSGGAPPPVASTTPASVAAATAQIPPAPAAPSGPAYLARRGDTVDTIHGVAVADPYRWLEDGASDSVRAWEALQKQRYVAHVDALPQTRWLEQRFQHLWRYDDKSLTIPCFVGKRSYFWTKKKDQDKWVFNVIDGPGKPARVVLDPNTWDELETLGTMARADDCRYVAYGVARAGNEDPVVRVLDLDTMEHLPDTLAGWQQGGISWLRDNSGFYYSAKPLKGEVPAGEEHYWHRAYYHQLGTTGDKDAVVFDDKTTKELHHNVSVSEDGKWLLLIRSRFNENELYLQELRKLKTPASIPSPTPMVTGLDAEYGADIIGKRILITTNWQAPKKRAMITSVRKPERTHWKELIPETDDPLLYATGIAGKIYVEHQHAASTRLSLYTTRGRKVRDIALPSIGSAGPSGWWSKPMVWIGFSSFAYPGTTFAYDARKNTMKVVHKSPIDVDPSNIAMEQVWYPSADGTRVSMFIVHRKDMARDGSTPFLLTGYGGFDVSMTPGFSTFYAVWLEAGGAVAIPNLRGGGEYGKAWHEAGMKERKQNVFDDFIAAAEFLIAQDYTRAERLAISGGSNGGLLVAAAVIQRPELFRAVECSVPLTDMVRYHKFGIANMWAEEYGSAEDPALFPALHAYSPYHRVVKGTDYPAVLVIGSENDARVDAMHARKFGAALQWADWDNGERPPIFIEVQRDSGHGGGVTIDTSVQQTARSTGFLMEQIGLQAPPE